MTTGTVSFGSTAGPFFSTKTWNGTNGKYAGSKLVWNPYTMSAVSGQSTPSRYYGVDYYVGYVSGPANINWTSNDTLALLADLGAACKGHTFNLGVATAEGRESIKMVVNTLTKVTSAVRAVKRGRIDLALRSLGATPQGTHGNRVSRVPTRGLSPSGNSPRSAVEPGSLTSRDVSSLWLEIQYGWRPLLQDVYESQRAFEVLTAPPRKFLVRVSRSRKWPDWKTENYYGKSLIESRSSKLITAEITESLSAPRSLGLENPASIAWELVPFSFVADWFIPIGTYLDALSVIPGLQGRFLLSTRDTSRGTGIGKNIPYMGASSTTRSTNLTRTTEAAFVVPPPKFNSLESSVTQGRVKNAIALLHQVVS